VKSEYPTANTQIQCPRGDGCWWLVVGCWALVVGYSLLVIGYSPRFPLVSVATPFRTGSNSDAAPNPGMGVCGFGSLLSFHALSFSCFVTAQEAAQEASVSRPFLADSPTPRGQAGMPDLLFAANSERTVSLPEQLPCFLCQTRQTAELTVHACPSIGPAGV